MRPLLVVAILIGACVLTAALYARALSGPRSLSQLPSPHEDKASSANREATPPEPELTAEERLLRKGHPFVDARTHGGGMRYEPPPEPERTETEYLEDLKSIDMMTRRNAAKYLSRRGDAVYIPAMIDAARSEQTGLKPILVEYLGQFGDDDRIIEFLIEQLDPKQRRLTTAAAIALSRITGVLNGEDPSAWREWHREREAEREDLNRLQPR